MEAIGRAIAMTTLIQVLTLLGAGTALTQVDSGSRVRVTTNERPGVPLVGTMLSVDTAWLRLLISRDEEWISVPTASLVRVERSRNRHARTGHGALLGAAIGAVSGLLLSAATAGSAYVGPSNGADVIAGSLRLAAAGAVVGALAGTGTHREQWEEVPLPLTQPIQ